MSNKLPQMWLVLPFGNHRTKSPNLNFFSIIFYWLHKTLYIPNERKLKWTKSGTIEVHFCIVFSVIKTFTINMLTKNYSFAKTISFPPFLIHYWIFWMKFFPSNSKFWHKKWDNELWGFQKYLNVYSHL